MKLYRVLLLTLCAYALISCGGAEERKAVYMEKAKISIAAGDFDKAIAHYREALRLDPNFGKAHNNLGNALVEQGRFAEAISHYSKALETKAYYPEAHNNLGAALARQGKLQEAIAQFRKALRLKPDYLQARDNLNLALQLVGKTTEPPRSSSRRMK